MEVPVLMELVNTLVSASTASKASTVKLTLMNASQTHATMEPLATNMLILILALALWDFRVLIVKRTTKIARTVVACMEELVLMELIHILVPANLGK